MCTNATLFSHISRRICFIGRLLGLINSTLIKRINLFMIYLLLDWRGHGVIHAWLFQKRIIIIIVFTTTTTAAFVDDLLSSHLEWGIAILIKLEIWR